MSTSTGAIDQGLLALIDQHAPAYYNSAWNLNLEQYKAWITTIARAEGGLGGYGAHSQGESGSDVFTHTGNASFKFSTGIGSFQLDRGGDDAWGYWATIDKLDPAKAVQTVMKQHQNHFGASSTLQSFADSSPWYAVNPNYVSNVSAQWLAVTGTNWDSYKNGRVSLDWSGIKTQLASNASHPMFRYESNVQSLGIKTWSIDSNDHLLTDTGKNILFNGSYDTWLVTARRWEGDVGCVYYYTRDVNTGMEVWVLDNAGASQNLYSYVFTREYAAPSGGQWPEHRASPGDILASPAFGLGGDTTRPTIGSFTVTPSSANRGQPFTISYTVSDSGGSGLNRVKLWRTNNLNSWPSTTEDEDPVSGNGPVPGNFSNVPPSAGDWWYGIHVADTAGNWITETQGGWQPIHVTVISPALPTLSINDPPSISEGDSGSMPLIFTATLSTASSQTVSVSYATANNSATAGSDYAATSGTLTFAPGETSKPVNVTIFGDTTFEGNEAFYVNISNPSGATITKGQGLGSIQDDDSPSGLPALWINDPPPITEGDSGSKTLRFTITMSGPSPEWVELSFYCANGTATGGSDYGIVSGGARIAPGQTTTINVDVPIYGDTLYEEDETFYVILSTVTGATIGDGQAMGVILNDDAPPGLPNDFGDAPAAWYPTLAAQNGAAHQIVTGLYLGAAIDGEADGQPNGSATGDDVNGIPDDEDGVIFPPKIVPDGTATISVTASAAGKLDAWIDFDADGRWSEPGDRIFTGWPLVAGVNSLSFPVPFAASAALKPGSGTTFARFRFSTAGGLSFDGPAQDGEVEDYQVIVQPPTFVGTLNPDTLSFSTDGVTHTVTVNGAVHRFDATKIRWIDFDGKGNTDQITITGWSGDEIAYLGKHYAKVTGVGLEVTSNGTEKITVVAGSGSTRNAEIWDAAGSDKFYAVFSTETKVSYIRYQDGSESRVYNFKYVEGRATLRDGDLDVAYMYDSSGNETYTGSEGSSSMILPGVYENVATGFERVYAYSTAPGAGQYDTATINDTPGNDRFYAYPNDGYVWYASGGLNFANGFNKVECRATPGPGGGNDLTIFNDSTGNDTLEAWIDRSTMKPTGGGSYENWAYDFDLVYAYGTAGGVDTALFHDGPGNDRFIAGYGVPNDSYLSYQSGQVAWSRGFEKVEGTATSGIDQAWLYDSPANDVYTAMNGTNEATMMPQSGTAYSRKAAGFDKYYAYATAGGTDEAHLYDSAGNDTLMVGNAARTKSPVETWLNYSTGPSAGMQLLAYAFEKTTAHGAGTAGDADTAYFYDDPASSETFTADQNAARFRRNMPGWDIRAEAFKAVYAYGTVTPANSAIIDIAEITDSAMNDLVKTYGAFNEGYIKYNHVAGPPETYDGFVDAKGFDSLKFKVTTGGIDTVDMTDSAGNDTFTGDLDWAQMVDELATYFFRIEGLSGGRTSGDKVIIRGTTGTNRDLSQATRDYVLGKYGAWV